MPAGCPRFCIFQGGVSAISKVVHELNEEIRDKEIRLIGAAGEQGEVFDHGVAEDRGAVEQFCPGEGTGFPPEAELGVESRMLCRAVEGAEVVGNAIDVHDGSS